MQLIQPGVVDMLDTMKNERRSVDYVVDKFGVPPERLGDVLALMGDSVDNVPGVPGIGPKTASKLIVEHGDLEGVLAAVPAMKPSKMRDNLTEHMEMARLSRKLVALHCEMTLPQALDTLKLDGIPPDPLRAFLEDQGFKTMLARLTGEVPMARPAPLGQAPVCRRARRGAHGNAGTARAATHRLRRLSHDHGPGEPRCIDCGGLCGRPSSHRYGDGLAGQCCLRPRRHQPRHRAGPRCLCARRPCLQRRHVRGEAGATRPWAR